MSCSDIADVTSINIVSINQLRLANSCNKFTPSLFIIITNYGTFVVYLQCIKDKNEFNLNINTKFIRL